MNCKELAKIITSNPYATIRQGIANEVMEAQHEAYIAAQKAALQVPVFTFYNSEIYRELGIIPEEDAECL